MCLIRAIARATMVITLAASCTLPNQWDPHPAPHRTVADRLLGRNSVECHIPAAGPSWDVIERWRICWWDGASIQTTFAPLGPDRETDTTVRLPVARAGAEAIVVTVTGETEAHGELRALGGWIRAPEQRLTVAVKNGDAAEVLLNLAERGFAPSLINGERLRPAVAEELQGWAGVDALGRPVGAPILDRDRLALAIGTGAMDRYAVDARERESWTVDLDAGVASGPDADPIGATWLTDDRRTPEITGILLDGSWQWNVPVAPGELRYLWQPKARLLLTIHRDREGHVWSFVRGY